MSEGLHFGHKLDCSAVQHSVQRGLTLLTSLVAPQITAENDRSPVDLVAVLDRSGSMAGAKLKAVKETATFLVQQMSAEDRLSIITFCNSVETEFSLKQMTAENKASAQAAIARVRASGGTNLSGGLFKGIDQHQQAVSSNNLTANHLPSTGSVAQQTTSERVRTVFLFTDGEATTGVVNTKRLCSILSAMLQNPVRPTIYCFGFGNSCDSEGLGEIAQTGQGQSSFIEDAESITPALASALGGLMSMSAQNVEVTFTPKEGVTIQAIETSFHTARVDGAFKVTLGDLYAEEKKDLLAKLQVSAVSEPQEQQELVTVSLRFVDLAVGGMRQESLTACIARPGEAPEGSQVDAALQEALHRVNTANAIKAAVQTGDAGDLPGARRLISKQLNEMASAPASEVINALRQDLQQLLSSYNDPVTFPSSRNQALSMANTHSSQRVSSHSSARLPPPTTAAGQRPQLGPYQTSSQSLYVQLSRGFPAPASTDAADALGDSSPRPEGLVDTGWATQPVGLAQSQAALGCFNRGRDMGAGLAGAAAAPQQGTTFNRTPSNVSDADTEIYDPWVERPTLANYGLAGALGMTRGLGFGHQPGTAQLLYASSRSRQLPGSFAFRNPAVPLAGSLSMPFRTISDRLNGSSIWANGTRGGSGTVATGALPGTGPLAAWTMGGATQPERASRLGSGSADNMDDVQQWMRSLGLEPVSDVPANSAEPRSTVIASGLSTTRHNGT